MEFIKNFWTKFYREFSVRRIFLFKITLALLTIILISLFVEIFIFSKIEKNKNEAITLNNLDMVAENFNLNEKNIFISNSENAILTIPNNVGYIKNLEVKFSGSSNLPIVIKYVDPKTNKEVILEKELQKSLKKNKLELFSSFIFGIRNNPEKIILQALKPQTSILEVKIDNRYIFNQYRFLFIMSVFGLILIFFALRKKVGKNPEYLFLTVALICGSLISISETRSFVSWDEKIHYQKVNKNSFRSIIRKDIKDIYSSPSTPSSYSIKEQNQIDKYFDNKYSKEKKIVKDNSLNISVNSYTKVGYIPSVVALISGRILHLPAHIIFILGRWINILVFSLVVFFAIRKLKSGKMILSVIALFPTSIYIASHYNYDSWVTAFTMLGLAYLFSELQQSEKKITLKEMIIMIGALVAGCGPKAVYFPLLLLLFLLKSSKFESLKQYKNFIIASIFSILFVISSFILPMFISGPGNGDERGGSAVNSTKQIEFIFSEPFTYAKILVHFTKDFMSLDNTNGFITNFANLGQVRGWLLLLVLLGVVVFTDKNEYDKITTSLKIRLWVIIVYLITIAFVATALYVSFTAVRSIGIAGVQLRYLIPLIFPLTFVLGSSRIENKTNKNVYNSIIFAIATFVLLQGIWDLIIILYY